MQYPKIQTIFLRDEQNIIIPDKFTTPEIEYLKNNLFECTEKIDGTNIRIEVNGTEVTIKGRADNSNIPTHLVEYLQEIFTPEKVLKALNVDPTIGIIATIYGEGYGYKIQAAGPNYLKDSVGFILFDINIGNKWWLKREDCESIAQSLNVPIVPFVGYMTLSEAITFVKSGFKSFIAENKDFNAEGLVLKTPMGLLDRKGERLIYKLKTCDFNKWDAAYGNSKEPVIQIPNENLNKE